MRSRLYHLCRVSVVTIPDNFDKNRRHLFGGTKNNVPKERQEIGKKVYGGNVPMSY